MATLANLFRLSREIREMIYDLVLEPVAFSNLYTARTAYTPETCPLLYVHQMITDELQHLLYKNHAIVVPFQEPSEYINNNSTFAQHLDKVTRRMKLQTDTIIIEIVQTEKARYPDNALDGIKNSDSYFWFDSEAGAGFPRRVVRELLSMKDQLPAVRTIKFVLWEGEWYMKPRPWSETLGKLLFHWEEVNIDVEINLFDYVEMNILNDDDLDDEGMNLIQEWHDDCEQIDRISFAANDFHYDDHEFGDYWGYRFDPAGFDHDEFYQMYPEERDEILYTGPVECRPLFVKTYMDRAGEY
ncbi:hypothetical protein ACHAPT_012745 [Fusarium lateritium]